jgi:hypothetical protein
MAAKLLSLRFDLGMQHRHQVIPSQDPRNARKPVPLPTRLFDRYGFREVTGLIYVTTAFDRNVVAQ